MAVGLQPGLHEPVGRAAVARTGSDRRGADGGKPERSAGGGDSDRGTAQPACPGFRGAADRRNHLRQLDGVSECVRRKGTENHHQLLHRESGSGGSDVGGARAAALRLFGGEMRRNIPSLEMLIN